MFLLRRPSSRQIARFLDRSRALPLSYQPEGLARGGADGFRVDEQVVPVGSGHAVFARAVTALSEWRHFQLGWVELFPPGAPIVTGTVVAVAIRHLGFWSLNGCRVAYGIGNDAVHEFGYAYGTLSNHGECGEEVFKVVMKPGTGEVSYVIRAA